jgi:hypothetical protein
MKHFILFIALGLFVLLTGTACTAQQRLESAKNAAEDLLTKISVLNSETQQKWGMTEFHIFGRINFLGAVYNQGEVKKTSETPETYEVKIPMWAEGTSLNGEQLKLKRYLYVQVGAPDNTSTFAVQSYEFRDDQPLSFLEQFLLWSLWGLVAPNFLWSILCYLWLIVVVPLSFGWLRRWQSCSIYVVCIIVGLVGLLFAGVVAYAFWGTAFSVVVGVIVYALVMGVLAVIFYTRADSP